MANKFPKKNPNNMLKNQSHFRNGGAFEIKKNHK